MSLSQYLAFREQNSKYNKIAHDIHVRQLERLKKHPETRIATKEFSEVIDFISREKNFPEIHECVVYSTTNKAIDSLDDFVKDEIKKELEKTEGKIDTSILQVLKSTIKSLVSAAGFFSLHTKEVYTVRDIFDRFYYRDGDKKGKKVSFSKFYKPERFELSEWLAMREKITIAHELLHYQMDSRCQSNSALAQEEYAYGHMIGYCQHIGLKEEEIIKGPLMSWGKIISASKDATLQYKERKKDWEKEGEKNAKKLFDQYQNLITKIGDGKVSTGYDIKRPAKFIEI